MTHRCAKVKLQCKRSQALQAAFSVRTTRCSSDAPGSDRPLRGPAVILSALCLFNEALSAQLQCQELLYAELRQASGYFSSTSARWLAIFTLPLHICLWAVTEGAIKARESPFSQICRRCRHEPLSTLTRRPDGLYLFPNRSSLHPVSAMPALFDTSFTSSFQ